MTDWVLPKIYTASSQIQIRPEGIKSVGNIDGQAADRPFDPTAFQAEFTVLQSPDVLLPIINDLKLDQAWAKQAKRQEKLTPLAMAVTKRYGIGGLKAAMDMIGFAGGAVRAPLSAPNADAQGEIAALIDQLGIQSVSKTDVRDERDRFAGVVRS